MVATANISTSTGSKSPSVSRDWSWGEGNPRVLMRDRDAVRQKVERIIADGPAKLQVVSDFDYTMSQFKDDAGEKCWTTHRVLETEVALLNPALGAQLDALKEKYMAIEFDPALSKEQKTPHMITWWETAHAMVVQAGLSKKDLEDRVGNSRIVLRKKCEEVVKMLDELGIPLVVFSAGIGDIIHLVVHRDFPDIPNYHLVANHMTYDHQGKVVGFSLPLVHTFNKNESVVGSERGLGEALEKRGNVLLLGDSLGDIHMDVGCKSEALALKIGFLNFRVEELKSKYLEVYDVVLVEEETWDFPLSIIAALKATLA